MIHFYTTKRAISKQQTSDKLRLLKNRAYLFRNSRRLFLEKRAPFASLVFCCKFYFRKFAATLPHITREAFVQSVCRAVAATKSVAAKGHLA